MTSHHRKVLGPGLVTETELQLHSSLDLAGIASLVLNVTVPDFADAGTVFVLEHPLDAGEIGGADGEVVARRLGIRLARRPVTRARLGRLRAGAHQVSARRHHRLVHRRAGRNAHTLL